MKKTPVNVRNLNQNTPIFKLEVVFFSDKKSYALFAALLTVGAYGASGRLRRVRAASPPSEKDADYLFDI